MLKYKVVSFVRVECRQCMKKSLKKIRALRANCRPRVDSVCVGVCVGVGVGYIAVCWEFSLPLYYSAALHII